MNINLDVSGLTEFTDFLKVSRSNLDSEMKKALDKAIDVVKGELETYPSATGSKYNRTGTLGFGWLGSSTQYSNNGTSADISNDTPYWPYVQQAGSQSHIHAGVWQTDQEILDSKEAEISALIQQALDNLFKGI